jgi:hypothetical protein
LVSLLSEVEYWIDKNLLFCVIILVSFRKNMKKISLFFLLILFGFKFPVQAQPTPQLKLFPPQVSGNKCNAKNVSLVQNGTDLSLIFDNHSVISRKYVADLSTCLFISSFQPPAGYYANVRGVTLVGFADVQKNHQGYVDVKYLTNRRGMGGKKIQFPSGFSDQFDVSMNFTPLQTSCGGPTVFVINTTLFALSMSDVESQVQLSTLDSSQGIAKIKLEFVPCNR